MRKRMITFFLSTCIFAQYSLHVSANESTDILSPTNTEEIMMEDEIETTEDASEISQEIIKNQEDCIAAELENIYSEENSFDESPLEIVDDIIPADSNVSEDTDNAMMALSSAREALMSLLSSKTVSALVYLCDYYELKETYETEGRGITSLPSGQLVFIKDVELDDMLNVWYKVSTYVNEQEYTGYIRKDYLAYSDEDFLAWESNYPLNYSLAPLNLQNGMADVTQFPTSYQSALKSLKLSHPNWIFVKMNTNLDWDYVIKNENYQDRSLVPSSSPSSWKSGPSGQKNWSIASEGIIKYYMDPRNFLNDPHIFQFEQLTYNASYHSQSAVQQILNSTFMNGTIPEDSRSYSQAFYDIGRSLGVSPFHLACRVYQEQGNGTSPLISGTYPGYEGLYNYFNIGASGSSTNDVIINGLKRARSEGWTTRYASLQGGANIISANYIRKGQDTLYLQKFDVDNSYNGMFYHQYMQNICAPTSESSNIRKAYNNTGSLNNPFVFKIPVYNNMPASACPQPKDYVFSDIEVIEGNWKYESVNYVYEKGLMTGISGTTLFKPDDPLTRAMFATILHRAAGTPAVTYTNRFSDVPSDQWYSNAIIWAYNKGIVSGYNDGSNRYGINDNITREQIAKMLYEYALRQGYNVSERQALNGFTDKDQVSPWAADYMSWAVGCGMISGKPNGDGTYRLDPKGYATRAECAAMLMRFLEKYT